MTCGIRGLHGIGRREALAIEVEQRLGGEHVVAALNRLSAQRQAPKYLFVDNGSEFSGRVLDLWADHHKARIDFSRPGGPTDNCYVETFNGSFRDECLNLHWFESLEEAKVIIEAWRRDYNETRPHMALDDASPEEFARKLPSKITRRFGLGNPSGSYKRTRLIEVVCDLKVSPRQVLERLN
jgi:putative transposase